MTDFALPALYRVFAPQTAEAQETGGSGVAGGLRVAVFSGEPARLPAAPPGFLRVVVGQRPGGRVTVDVDTPSGGAWAAGAGAVAALTWWQAQGGGADALELELNGAVRSAQLCGGEWLLLATVQVQDAPPLPPVLADPGRAWVAAVTPEGQTGGAPPLAPHLLLQGEGENMAGWTPGPGTITALTRAAGATSVTVFTPGGPGRADVSFRVFGPDGQGAASADAFACVAAVFGVAGLVPADVGTLRGEQQTPEGAARFTAQLTPLPGGAASVWVGGSTVREPALTCGAPPV